MGSAIDRTSLYLRDLRSGLYYHAYAESTTDFFCDHEYKLGDGAPVARDLLVTKRLPKAHALEAGATNVCVLEQLRPTIFQSS